MRVRLLSTVVLVPAVLVMMGAATRLADPPSATSALGRHPFLKRLKADVDGMEREAGALAGLPADLDLAELLTLVEAWRAGEGLTACGHTEEHELVGTRCSRGAGGELDSLYLRILERWWRRGQLDAGQVTLLYGGMPPFLAATHALEGTWLVPTLIDLPPAAIRAERERLVADGLSGATRWSTETISGILADRVRAGVDLEDLRRRLVPAGTDLRLDFMEGVVRPLGLWMGATGTGGESLQEFVRRFGPGGTERLGASLGALPAAPVESLPIASAPAPAPEPVAVVEALSPVPPALPRPAARPEPEPAPPVAAPPPAAEVRVHDGGFAVTFGGSRFR